MNSTAARRTTSRPKVVGAPPYELFTEGVLAVQVLSNGRGRGRNLVRSLSVQITYATIDATSSTAKFRKLPSAASPVTWTAP